MSSISLLTLLGRDPAIRSSWRPLAIAIALALLFSPLVYGPIGAGQTDVAMAVFWMPNLLASLIFWVMGSRVLQRAGEYELALPIPARRLWLSRTLSLLISSLLPFSVISAVMAAVDPNATWPVLCAAAAWSLGLAVLLSLSPSSHRIPVRVPFWLICLLTPLTMGVALVFSSIGLALALSVAAVLVAAGTYARIPQTLSLAPGTATGTSGRRDASRRLFSAGSSWLIFRTLYGGSALFWLAYLSLMCLAMGFNDLSDGLFVIMVTLSYFAAVQATTRRLHHLADLPIPRRLLLRFVLLPGLVVLVAGYWAGTGIHRLAREPAGVLELTWDSHHDGLTNVPARFWSVAWNGQPEPMVSPWNESHTPQSIAPFLVLPMALYNPFEAPGHASGRFISWQISRALAAVSESEIRAEEIEWSYLHPGSTEATSAWSFDMNKLAKDYPQLRAYPTVPSPVAVVGIGYCIWMSLVVVLVQRLPPPWRGLGRVRVGTSVIQAVSLLTLVAPVFANLSAGPHLRWAAEHTWRILADRGSQAINSAITPLGSWGVVLLLLGCMYFVLEHLYQRVESLTESDRVMARMKLDILG